MIWREHLTTAAPVLLCCDAVRLLHSLTARELTVLHVSCGTAYLVSFDDALLYNLVLLDE